MIHQREVYQSWYIGTISFISWRGTILVYPYSSMYNIYDHNTQNSDRRKEQKRRQKKTTQWSPEQKDQIKTSTVPAFANLSVSLELL